MKKFSFALITLAISAGLLSLNSCSKEDAVDDENQENVEVEDNTSEPEEEIQDEENAENAEVLPEGVSSLSSRAVTLKIKLSQNQNAKYRIFEKGETEVLHEVEALVSRDNETSDYIYVARISELIPETLYDFKLVSYSGNEDLSDLLSFKTKEDDIKAPKMVDLGLSVKWADANVGATSEEESGGYYAWGETEEKNRYLPETSLTYQKEMDDFSGNPEYDIATKLWGKGWRMPTAEEFEELRTNCEWTWAVVNGMTGHYVSGNGNKIFLPAAGYHYSITLKHWMTHGVYWTSTPKDSQLNTANYFTFDNSNFGMFGLNRYDGMTIRAVYSK